MVAHQSRSMTTKLTRQIEAIELALRNHRVYYLAERFLYEKKKLHINSIQGYPYTACFYNFNSRPTPKRGKVVSVMS